MNRLVTAAARLLRGAAGLLGLRVAVRGEDAVQAAGAAAGRTIRLHALLVEQVVQRVTLLRRLRGGDLLLPLDRSGRLLDVLGRDGSGRRLGDGVLHLLGPLRLPFLL